MNKDVTDLIAWLGSQGFKSIRGGRHFMITHPETPGVTHAVPKSPSDHRWEQNLRSELRALFVDARSVDWDAWPGRKTSRTTTLQDRYSGAQVVTLIRELRGPKGNQIFAKRLREVVRDGVATLEVANPWFVRGSNDPMRRTATFSIVLPKGNQKLGQAAVDTLARIGIGMDAATEAECQGRFTRFARSQRSVRIREYRAIKAAQREVVRGL